MRPRSNPLAADTPGVPPILGRFHDPAPGSVPRAAPGSEKEPSDGAASESPLEGAAKLGSCVPPIRAPRPATEPKLWLGRCRPAIEPLLGIRKPGLRIPEKEGVWNPALPGEPKDVVGSAPKDGLCIRNALPVPRLGNDMFGAEKPLGTLKPDEGIRRPLPSDGMDSAGPP